MAASENPQTVHSINVNVAYFSQHFTPLFSTNVQKKQNKDFHTLHKHQMLKKKKNMFMCENCTGYFSDMKVFNEHECEKEKEHANQLDEAKKKGAYSQSGTAVWNRETTLLLVSTYKDLKPLLDSGKLRKKDLWDKRTCSLQPKGFSFSPEQVCGRWKSITRAYKNVKDHNKKSGAEHKTYEYEDELDDILGSDPAVDPEFVMASSSSSAAPEQPATTSHKRKEKKNDNGSESEGSSSSASGSKIKAKQSKRVRKSGGSTNGESIVDIFKKYVSDQEEEWQRRESLQKQRLEVLTSLVDVLKGDRRDTTIQNK